MIAESFVTGGVVAVALGAMEVAKASLAKRRNGSIDVMLKVQDRTMRDLMREARNQSGTLTRILAIIEAERGQR